MTVLLALGALSVFGIAHGSESEPINLIITTHNPACTAVHLDYLGAVRLTDVKPWLRYSVLGYTHTEITNGVNVTAVVWARDSNMTIQSVLERPEVSGVAAYSYIAPNSNEAPTLLARYDNLDVIRPDMGLPTSCGMMHGHMLLSAMDDVGWDGAGPGAMPADRKEVDHTGPCGPATAEPPLTLDAIPATRINPESGTVYAGDLMGVEIYTSNNTSVWAYLKGNGALVTGAGPGMVSGFVPSLVLWPLSMRDDVSWMRATEMPVLNHYGGANADGPLVPGVASGIIHGHESDLAPIYLNVTTHNPVCTTAFLHHINVTRLTDVRPLYRDGVRGYSADQYESGVNVTAIIWPRDAAKVMRAIAERTEVRGVAAYPHGTQNAAGPSPPLALAVNPDVETPEFYGASTRCDVMPNLHLLQMFMDEVVGWNGAPDPVPGCAVIADEPAESASDNLILDPRPTDERIDPKSGLYYHGDLVRASVWTYNVTDTWAHLQKNGALVMAAIGDDGSLGLVGTYMPVSLMWSLYERDGVRLVELAGAPMIEYHQ